MHKLYIGSKFTGVSVVSDNLWPGMWRVSQGDRLSDMVNLTRAKDAAIAWARPRGLGGEEVVHWTVGKHGAGEARITQTEVAARVAA